MASIARWNPPVSLDRFRDLTRRGVEDEDDEEDDEEDEDKDIEEDNEDKKENTGVNRSKWRPIINSFFAQSL